jgi:hypothetical protein
MRAGKRVGLAFPFVELAECRRIAVECGQETPVFQYGLRQQIRVGLAGSAEFRSIGLTQLTEQGARAAMVLEAPLHRREAENIFGVLKTPVPDFAHEFQNSLNVVAIDFVAAFHPFTDQPQDFQTAINDLMFPCS